jgi:hypothetical protein
MSSLAVTSTTLPFKTPLDSELYFDHVVQRCRYLIGVNIWGGISLTRLEEWIGVFNTDAERYLAACVLDSLIYRSTNQVKGLMTQLLQRGLPENLELLSHKGIQEDWQELLAQDNDPSIRMVPVLRDDDPPSKSGPMITRLYKHLVMTNDQWMIWPWQMTDAELSHVRHFLLVDDFLGTGDQFIKFVKRTEFEKLIGDKRVIYSPLIAHACGIAKVKEVYPDVVIVPAEVIDGDYNLFGKQSRLFIDGSNSLESAKAFYEEFFRRNNATISKDYLYGKGELGLTLAFEFSIPNASIPLLWSKKGSLKPLFER